MPVLADIYTAFMMQSTIKQNERVVHDSPLKYNWVQMAGLLFVKCARKPLPVNIYSQNI